MNSRASARELIEAIVDPGSWHGWDEPVAITTDDPDYRADLERARERTGLDESVITGEGRIEGRRVALVACEFRFLAGSIGVAAGERLVRAVERATAERLPLLAAPASGGTRMQEGTVAFLQMVKVAAAITDHKAAGLPYLVHLRHPTTGGVLASWGSLGHVTAAEPGALIGFMGPRVHEALYGEEFPPGVQNAENLMNHGLIDAVLPLSRLSGVAARVLRVLCAGGPATAPDPGAVPASGAAPAAEEPGRSGAGGGASTEPEPEPAPGAPGAVRAVGDGAAPRASAAACGAAGPAAEAKPGTPGGTPERREGSSAGAARQPRPAVGVAARAARSRRELPRAARGPRTGPRVGGTRRPGPRPPSMGTWRLPGAAPSRARVASPRRRRPGAWGPPTIRPGPPPSPRRNGPTRRPTARGRRPLCRRRRCRYGLRGGPSGPGCGICCGSPPKT
nr:acetyl-CoA carboxylase carboxyltransferase subunit beta [Streptomyces antimycoticus]